MVKKKSLEDKDWVIEYITEWIETNTNFKVDKLVLNQKKEQRDEVYKTFEYMM